MLLSRLQITRDQLSEWTENPVTVGLRTLIQEQLDGIANTPISEALVLGEPQRTQDSLVSLAAIHIDYLDFIEYLNGEWSNLEGEEYEQVGDLPVG